ncbi:MAG: GerW family sporulation protein [Methanosarcinaceae archaeon]|nr:GerW family sporulation protein [Methanosarcinaceae archaeon]
MGIEDLMKEIAGENQSIINSKTLLGEPFTWAGKTVMPVIKVSAGYGSAGGERKKETSHGFAGAGYTGVNMEPIAFVVISDEDVRLLSITGKHRYSSVIDLIPEVASKIPEAVDRAKEASSGVAEKARQRTERAGKLIREKGAALRRGDKEETKVPEEKIVEEEKEVVGTAEETETGSARGKWGGSSK